MHPYYSETISVSWHCHIFANTFIAVLSINQFNTFVMSSKQCRTANNHHEQTQSANNHHLETKTFYLHLIITKYVQSKNKQNIDSLINKSEKTFMQPFKLCINCDILLFFISINV